MVTRAAVAEQQEWIRSEITEHINTDAFNNIISAAVIKAIEPLIIRIDKLAELITIKDEKINALVNQNKDLILKQTELEETIKKQHTSNIKLRSEMNHKVDFAESYTRKDSVRISGIPITPDEENDALTDIVINTLSQHGAIIDKQDIFRLHRSGKPQLMNKFKEYANKQNVPKLQIDANDRTETAEVLVKFTRWEPRMRVYNLKYTKNLPIRVRADLTKYRQEVLKMSREHLRANNLAGYCYNNAECKLILCDAIRRRRHHFSSMAEFETLCRNELDEDPTFHTRGRAAAGRT